MRVLAWPAHAHAARNPYQHLLYREIETRGADVFEFTPKSLMSLRRIDIFHVHWPDAFLAAGAGVGFWWRLFQLRVIVCLARLRGARLVWTAHNVMRPHQRNGARMKRWFWPWWSRRVDGVIYLSETSRKACEELLPSLRTCRNAIVPHGHYRTVIAPHFDSTQVRPVSPCGVFFGSLTSYKQPSAFITAFSRTSPGAMNVILAGEVSVTEPDPKLGAALEDVPEGLKGYLEVRLGFLAEGELVRVLQSADVAVFPYETVLNSGAVLYALSAGVPVLTSDRPVFAELQQLVGNQWVWLYEGELTAGVLQAAACHGRALKDAAATPDLSALEWPRLARLTLDFYLRLTR